jgi:hypothetical protein
MPRTEDEESDGIATLCDNCCQTLQKALLCARCKTATYCSKDCQVHAPNRKRGGLEAHGLVKGIHKHERD